MTFKRRSTQGENTTANYRNRSGSSSTENEVTVVIEGENARQSIISQLKRIKNPKTVNSIMEVEEKKFNTFRCPLMNILLIVGVVVVVLLLVAAIVWLLMPGGRHTSSNLIELVERLKDNQLDVNVPKEQWLWHRKAYEELHQRLLYSNQNGRLDKLPQNVIFFVGDGMGPNTVTAARIYGKGEENLLRWEKFPDMGLLKVEKKNNLFATCISLILCAL